MKIICDIDNGSLERFRPRVTAEACELIISGYWFEDTHHSGHIAYYVARLAPGEWALDAVERNTILDDVTEDDIEQVRLNDDQLQALWGSTLQEAQSQVYRQIIAYCSSENDWSSADIGAKLYKAILEKNGKKVVERDDK
jgi:hypothetical protein